MELQGIGEKRALIGGYMDILLALTPSVDNIQIGHFPQELY